MLCVLFCSCEWGLLFTAVHGLLTAAASLVAEHRLEGLWASAAVVSRLNSCHSQALEHRLNGCGTSLVAPRYEGSSQTRDHTCVSCFGKWILHL